MTSIAAIVQSIMIVISVFLLAIFVLGLLFVLFIVIRYFIDDYRAKKRKKKDLDEL